MATGPADPPTREARRGLNPERVGHVYPSYRYEVSRAKVTEYALVCGADDPVYTADPANVSPEDVVAPPTFAACLAQPTVVRDDPELGWHWNLVHGGQEYEFHRPVRVGDVLECTPRITELKQRGRMDILTVEVDCVDAASQNPVVTSRATLIFFDEGEGPAAAGPAGGDQKGEGPAAAGPAGGDQKGEGPAAAGPAGGDQA